MANRGEVVDLPALVQASAVQGAIWSHAGDDLNANLVRLDAGEGVGEHVNADVEVLLVGILGEGTVEIEGRQHRITAGQLLIIPKGTARAIQAEADGFSYLTCHRRRAGLWPENRVCRAISDSGSAAKTGATAISTSSQAGE